MIPCSPGPARMPVRGLTRISLMPAGTRNGTAGALGKRDLEEVLDDRRRELAAGAAAAEVARLVVADIDADHHLGREADEPGILLVVGGAGLAGDRLADLFCTRR